MDLFGPSDPANSPSTNRFAPLATRMRPLSLQEYTGQTHLLGDGMLLRRMIEEQVIGSVIFYGPPSSGKTTLAYVISNEMNALFLVLNAVLDGVKDLKLVVDKARAEAHQTGRRTLLFVDEIHRWNKAQQDALLPHLESGLLTLIGATTENPYYALVGPLLSRCQLFELQPYTVDDIKALIQRSLEDTERGLAKMKPDVDPNAIIYLAEIAGGDIRNALNALETAVMTSKPDVEGRRYVDLDKVKQAVPKRVLKFDRTGNEHYHYASAFIKSMRGSDPDASLYWMTALIESGEDPNFVFRRLHIFCSEDIGLADPGALILVEALHESFRKTGMPEGWYFLAHATLYCATAPKSNSTAAIFQIIDHIRERGVDPVPYHLRDKTANALEAKYRKTDNPSDNYLYPHNYPGNWVDQQYLPDPLKKQTWFQFGDQGREKSLADRLDQLKKVHSSKEEHEK
jgi:putative ATPase